MIFLSNPKIQNPQRSLDYVVEELMSRSKDSIEKHISNYEKIDPFYLNTFNDYVKVYPNRESLRNTFAFNLVDFCQNTKIYAHQIVVNKDLCEKFELTAAEIAAVVFHELGHIFNYRQPTLEENISPSKKAQYKLETEFRADYFAIIHNFNNEIISSLEKSLKNTSWNNDEIEQRLERINNDDYPYPEGEYKQAIF